METTQLVRTSLDAPFIAQTRPSICGLRILLVCLAVIIGFGFSNYARAGGASHFLRAKERKPTPSELKEILRRHSEWLHSFKVDIGSHNYPADLPFAEVCIWNAEEFKKRISDSRVASLSKANLSRENLQGAELAFSDLSSANLSNARLQGANLSGANLENAVLIGADLSGAMLIGANLSGARLDHAVLRNINPLHWAHPSSYTFFVGTRLWHTDLRDADLSFAKLNKAYISNALMAGTNLRHADMESVHFEPRPESTPDADAFIWVKNLSKMDYWVSSTAALAKVFQKLKIAGDREHAKQVLYVINKARHSGTQGILHTLFFDLTCLYGMSPGRPLLILIFLIPVFSLIYSLAIGERTTGRTGIWQVWLPDRILKDEGQDEPVRIRVHGIRRFWISLYFSLISAFHFGWRELNVGNWIARCQSYEYRLHGSGWIRSVSGLQAILSVYLLALTILSFFGYPFE